MNNVMVVSKGALERGSSEGIVRRRGVAFDQFSKGSFSDTEQARNKFVQFAVGSIKFALTCATITVVFPTFLALGVLFIGMMIPVMVVVLPFAYLMKAEDDTFPDEIDSVARYALI